MTEKKAKSRRKSVSEKTTVTAYKGFDAQMRCHGEFQYEVGKTYEHAGPVKACESGFHSCENPLDVWNYYPPSGGNIFAEVEASGKIARHDCDTKVASAALHVKAVLSLPDFIGRAVEWLKAHCGPATSNHATGDRSASSATGDSSASLATGWYSSSEITAAEDGKPLHAAAIATGYQSKARAPAGSCIVLCERNDKGELLHIRASKVGENGVKPDVWYTLTNGELVEAR